MSVETATQQIGTLFGLSGRSLEEYTSLASVALQEEVEPLQTLLSFYKDRDIADEEIAINLERILKGKKKFCEMRREEQEFVQAIPFSRRSRALLYVKQAMPRPKDTDPYHLLHKYPAHLSDITAITTVQAVPGTVRYNILTASKDQTLHIRSSDGKRNETLASVCSPIQSVVYMPSGKIVTVDEDGDLYVNPLNGRGQKGAVDETDSFESEPAYYGLEPLDKERIARLTPDQTVQIWRHSKAHDEGMPIQTMPVDNVMAITRLPNGHLVTASSSAIRVWDCSSHLRSVCIQETPLDSMEPILLVALSNSKVAFVHKGFPFRIYTVTLGQLPTYTETSSVIKSLTVNRAKQHLVAGCYDGALHIWDLANPETQETTLFVGPAPITALSVLPDDSIACGDLYGMLYVLSLPVPVPAS